MMKWIVYVASFLTVTASFAAGQSTALQQVRNRAENRLPTAPEKTLDDFTYEDLMKVEPVQRRRVLHLLSPDKQWELVTSHLVHELEMHRNTLSSLQETYIERTLEELQPKDFVRRKMTESERMRAWQGDRLGRLYRKTDLEAFRQLFSGALAREIFLLQ